ncbi:hypothetical protein Tco_0568686 [Tanacetum coccineum]
MALNRSKSRYAIKECSTCGSWYTKKCCSIGNLKDQIIVPVSDSFQHCAVLWNTPVDDTSESFNDNTNIVNASQEPSVVDQDPVLLEIYKIHNEIQPLKQEILNQIQKDQEEKSIVELLAEERFQKDNQVLNESQSSQEMKIQDLEFQKQQCLEEMKEWMNELGIREYRKEEIDIDFRRKCEDKIYELKEKFNCLSIEIRKITQEAKELRESEARVQSRKIIIDDDDDDLGFYAVHPNTIHIFPGFAKR